MKSQILFIAAIAILAGDVAATLNWLSSMSCPSVGMPCCCQKTSRYHARDLTYNDLITLVYSPDCMTCTESDNLPSMDAYQYQYNYITRNPDNYLLPVCCCERYQENDYCYPNCIQPSTSRRRRCERKFCPCCPCNRISSIC